MPILSRLVVSMVALLGLGLLSGQTAHAQFSTTTYRTNYAFTGINYEDISAPSAFAYGSYYFGAASIAGEGSTSYAFADGAGEAFGVGDTITLSGSGAASAAGFGFTDLKARITATLENAYLDLRNPENAPEYGNGMKAPAHWIASASAGFTIDHRFNAPSSAGNGYTVKWIWGVDGVTNSDADGYGAAYLRYSHGANAAQYFSTTSLAPQLWATTPVPVTWTDWAQTSVDFTAQWQYSMIGDGTPTYDSEGSLIGYVSPDTQVADVNYYSTAKLQEIQVFDENGNRFYDFTVEDRSGSIIYDGAAVTVVPEASTLTLALPALAMIGAVVLRKRKIA